jgi:trypsin
VGGAETAPLAYPFVASLQRYASHVCGATIIARGWALTAAHCIVTTDKRAAEAAGRPVEASLLRLLVHEHEVGGAESPSTSCSGYVGIAQVVSHPGYSQTTYEHDIALLRLAEARPAECVATLPALDREPTAAVPGARVVVAGWGRTSPGGAYPNVMHAVTLDMVSELCPVP